MASSNGSPRGVVSASHFSTQQNHGHPTAAGGVLNGKRQEPGVRILRQSFGSALGGGITGMGAACVQVGALMWLHTTMTYQYRYGHSTLGAMRILYNEGGILRFYRGFLPALALGPLARFVDTAANAGVLALLDSTEVGRRLPIYVQTGFASITSGSFRIVLMPVDTVKTIMQVEGRKGLASLRTKARLNGPQVLYHGATAAAAATTIGHYPWFMTYNILDAHLSPGTGHLSRFLRNAGIGLCASTISDVCSNSARVIKTHRQTNPDKISYLNSARRVLAADGIQGLLFRGLGTRIVSHGLNSMLFTVVWKYFQDEWLKDRQKPAKTAQLSKHHQEIEAYEASCTDE